MLKLSAQHAVFSLLLAALLVLSFFLRLEYLPYPHWQEDGNRDYLVAHHMVALGELPDSGPRNGLDERLQNPPLYFYMLAAPLLVQDDVFTLAYFNILLQTAAVFFVYLIGNALAGRWAGLLAGVIFSINPIALHKSQFIWQPWAMEPVLLLALLAGVYSLKHQSLLLGAASLLLWTAASMIHYSALGLLPIFCIGGAWPILGRSRYSFFLLFLGAIAPFAFAALLLPSFALHYATPLSGIVAVFLGVLATKGTRIGWVAAGALIMLSAWNFPAKPYFSEEHPALFALANQITAEKVADFDIKTYKSGVYYSPLEAAFWRPLEKILGKTLVRVDSADARSYSPLARGERIFHICLDDPSPCQNDRADTNLLFEGFSAGRNITIIEAMSASGASDARRR